MQTHRATLLRSTPRPLFAVLVALAIAAGCGDDEGVGLGGGVVGGACRDDFDCASRCVRGGDFPGGTCTVRCRDDFDCPDSTFCVDKEGGVCLLACRDSRDCRPGYACKDEDAEGARGSVPVCIED